MYLPSVFIKVTIGKKHTYPNFPKQTKFLLTRLKTQEHFHLIFNLTLTQLSHLLENHHLIFKQNI